MKTISRRYIWEPPSLSADILQILTARGWVQHISSKRYSTLRNKKRERGRGSTDRFPTDDKRISFENLPVFLPSLLLVCCKGLGPQYQSENNTLQYAIADTSNKKFLRKRGRQTKHRPFFATDGNAKYTYEPSDLSADVVASLNCKGLGSQYQFETILCITQ